MTDEVIKLLDEMKSERERIEQELLDLDPLVRKGREAGYDVTDKEDPAVIFVPQRLCLRYQEELGFSPFCIRTSSLVPDTQVVFARLGVLHGMLPTTKLH